MEEEFRIQDSGFSRGELPHESNFFVASMAFGGLRCAPAVVSFVELPCKVFHHVGHEGGRIQGEGFRIQESGVRIQEER